MDLLPNGRRRELDSVVVNIELTLVSIIQGVALFFLTDNARALLSMQHARALTIRGERKRKSTNGEKAERTERYIGTFRRSIALPTRVDASKVSATYRDGILTVILPKAEEVKPKQIQVS